MEIVIWVLRNESNTGIGIDYETEQKVNQLKQIQGDQIGVSNNLCGYGKKNVRLRKIYLEIKFEIRGEQI